jgi:hypothetical protein
VSDWRDKARDAGLTIVTLGISWLVKRHVAKRVPARAAELVEDMARGKVADLPPEVQRALETLARERFEFDKSQRLAEIAATAKRLEATFEKHEQHLKRLEQFWTKPP